MSQARPRPPDRSASGSNDVFDVLSNRRRRYALHYLKRRSGPVSLAELSRQVTGWEQGMDPEGLTYEDRKSVYTSLSQFHLPKMHEAGLVLAVAAGFPGLAGVPGLALAELVAAAFLCSSLAFLYDSQYRMRPGRDGRPPERVDRN